MKKLIILLLMYALNVYADGVSGLTYYTYRGTGAYPNYTNLAYPTPLSTGTVSTINYNWGGGYVLNSGRAEQVIVKFTGYVNIPTAGLYYFGGNADDGLVIKVNNNTVLNSWIEDGGNFRYGSVNLPAGVLPIEVWYYENGGGALVNLQWYNAQTGWQIVPSTSLATDSTYWTPAIVITTEQQNKLNAARARQTYKNEVNIDQIGNYNNIDVIQSGFYNLVDVTVLGDSNNVDVSQSGIKHYTKVYIDGAGNTVNSYQSNTTNLSPGHFSEMLITGNSNTVINSQTGEGEKSSFISINGSANNINNSQTGSAAKYSDIKATGNGHTVVVDQKDGGTHKARVEVINSGGASNINLLQQGNTPQSYILQQTCANIGGCSLSIVQQ